LRKEKRDPVLDLRRAEEKMAAALTSDVKKREGKRYAPLELIIFAKKRKGGGQEFAEAAEEGGGKRKKNGRSLGLD